MQMSDSSDKPANYKLETTMLFIYALYCPAISNVQVMWQQIYKRRQLKVLT